ncbi:MAG: 30S ribosomal protein S16 [Prevotellaceae bacterium]|jgi:small subunit ribosomal protein S16|nr:30S ribosomal protein S16 [Prevotellaceae bacterium]
MAVRIRLARHGKKNYAFFHVIVADSRAPRDGRFIERIGTYNPNTNPAIIELDADKALQWLNNGAQPSDTCRRILSYKGVLLKKHLMEGVKKGAVTEEAAVAKWEAWLQEKAQKVANKKSSLEQNQRNERKVLLQAEAKVNEEKAAALAKKRNDAAIKAAAAKAAATAADEEDTTEEQSTKPAAAPEVVTEDVVTEDVTTEEVATEEVATEEV